MFKLCANFTAAMRAMMAKVLELFLKIQTQLQALNSKLPARLRPPIMKFTTPCGETITCHIISVRSGRHLPTP
jgi:hypothetical protein